MDTGQVISHLLTSDRRFSAARTELGRGMLQSALSLARQISWETGSQKAESTAGHDPNSRSSSSSNNKSRGSSSDGRGSAAVVSTNQHKRKSSSASSSSSSSSWEKEKARSPVFLSEDTRATKRRKDAFDISDDDDVHRQGPSGLDAALLKSHSQAQQHRQSQQSVLYLGQYDAQTNAARAVMAAKAASEAAVARQRQQHQQHQQHQYQQNQPRVIFHRDRRTTEGRGGVNPHVRTQPSLPWAQDDNAKEILFHSERMSEFLHNELVLFANFALLNDADRRLREWLIKEIERILQKGYDPRVRLSKFGSFAIAGLSTYKADIDLCIHNWTTAAKLDKLVSPGDRDAYKQKTALYLMTQLLSSRLGRNFSVDMRLSAKCPIVNIRQHSTQVEVDLRLAGTGDPTDSFVEWAAEKYPLMRPVTIFLKVFLQSRDLDKPFTGGIGSFKLYGMVVHLMQLMSQKTKHQAESAASGGRAHESAVVVDQDMGDPNDAGHVLWNFFKYYSTENTWGRFSFFRFPAHDLVVDFSSVFRIEAVQGAFASALVKMKSTYRANREKEQRQREKTQSQGRGGRQDGVASFPMVPYASYLYPLLDVPLLLADESKQRMAVIKELRLIEAVNENLKKTKTAQAASSPSPSAYALSSSSSSRTVDSYFAANADHHRYGAVSSDEDDGDAFGHWSDDEDEDEDEENSEKDDDTDVYNGADDRGEEEEDSEEDEEDDAGNNGVALAEVATRPVERWVQSRHRWRDVDQAGASLHDVAEMPSVRSWSSFEKLTRQEENIFEDDTDNEDGGGLNKAEEKDDDGDDMPRLHDERDAHAEGDGGAVVGPMDGVDAEQMNGALVVIVPDHDEESGGKKTGQVAEGATETAPEVIVASAAVPSRRLSQFSPASVFPPRDSSLPQPLPTDSIVAKKAGKNRDKARRHRAGHLGTATSTLTEAGAVDRDHNHPGKPASASMSASAGPSVPLSMSFNVELPAKYLTPRAARGRYT